MNKEENEYILGTDSAELHRLGLQHQVWASEAQAGWKTANFTSGHTLLDLGCGPGFCTKELAYIVGPTGKVIGVDKSAAYIKFLNKTKDLHNINIEAIETDFDKLELKDNSLDGMYCRWALAWVPNPEEILSNVHKALKPGGKMVIHEYFDWSTHQTEPSLPHLNQAIAACLKSFKDQPGDIDVGRSLSKSLTNIGMNIVQTRPMLKMAQPHELTWQWPQSFYEVYFPKLVEMGFLSVDEMNLAFDDLKMLINEPYAQLCCPTLIEVIAEKR